MYTVLAQKARIIVYSFTEELKVNKLMKLQICGEKALTGHCPPTALAGVSSHACFTSLKPGSPRPNSAHKMNHFLCVHVCMCMCEYVYIRCTSIALCTTNASCSLGVMNRASTTSSKWPLNSPLSSLMRSCTGGGDTEVHVDQ